MSFGWSAIARQVYTGEGGRTLQRVYSLLKASIPELPARQSRPGHRSNPWDGKQREAAALLLPWDNHGPTPPLCMPSYHAICAPCHSARFYGLEGRRRDFVFFLSRMVLPWTRHRRPIIKCTTMHRDTTPQSPKLLTMLQARPSKITPIPFSVRSTRSIRSTIVD